MKRWLLGWLALVTWLPPAAVRPDWASVGPDPFELVTPAFVAEDGSFGAGSPDVALATGTTHLVLVRNNSVTLFTRPTGAEAPRKVAEMDSRAFLQPAAQGDDKVADPYALWDGDAGRFFISMAAFGKTGCETTATCTGSILLVVSKSASPATLTAADWYFYRLDRQVHRVGGVARHVDDEGDFDKLAIVGDSLLISWQMVTHGTAVTTLGQAVRLLDRRALMRGETPATWLDVELPPIPAGSERMRMAAQYEPRDGQADRVFLDVRPGCAGEWKIAALLDLRGTPRLESQTIAAPITCPSYPLTSAQPGTAVRIAIQHQGSQPAYRDGRLWVFEPVGRSAVDDTAEIVWAELDVRAWPQVTVLQSGRLSAGASNAFGAAAALDSVGNLGVLYTQAGANEYPSLYYTGRLATDPPGRLRPPRLLRAGVRASTVTGVVDYQMVTADAIDGSLWLAGPALSSLAGRRLPDSVVMSDIVIGRIRPIATAQPGVPAMALSTNALQFAAVVSGTSFTAQTGSQVVRLTQSGAGTVTWAATSTRPWLKVSPPFGTGAAALTVSVQGPASTDTGQIAFTVAGATGTVGPLAATLTVTGTSRPPFGALDTPSDNAVGLSGSIAVTGWALDDIGVTRVELWRDPQAGETTVPFAGAANDPRSGKIFIANPVFVDQARPDIEALNPATPLNYRAGWGYLLLTWGLWNQGNGTYKLHAFAFDQEGSISTIGARTIAVSNNTATKPFGSIDTPAIGGDPGTMPNFGWALTPKTGNSATCRIPSNGVQVSIDSGPLQPVVYGDVRSDIAGAFPGLSNASAAGGHFLFDWSTLPSGTHTIGWLVTDDCNRADGVGSRFFTVTSGSSALAAAPGEIHLTADTSSDVPFRLKAETTGSSGASPFRPNENAPVLVSRGFTDLPALVAPDSSGRRRVEVRQGDRIEIRVPRGFESAYQLGPGGRPRALPVGSTWDAASATFYWQPAPGFLGRYWVEFTNGREQVSVRIVVVPQKVLLSGFQTRGGAAR